LIFDLNLISTSATLSTTKVWWNSHRQVRFQGRGSKLKVKSACVCWQRTVLWGVWRHRRRRPIRSQDTAS